MWRLASAPSRVRWQPRWWVWCLARAADPMGVGERRGRVPAGNRLFGDEHG